jgi:hypothetical protein
MASIEREFARRLIDGALSLNDAFNKLDVLSEELPSDLKKTFRRELGEVVAGIYTEIIIPIVREHPDLDPYK